MTTGTDQRPASDFGESEEQSKEVREALVEQTLNPVFTPAKADPMLRFDLFSPLRGATWAEEFDSPFAQGLKWKIFTEKTFIFVTFVSTESTLNI